MKKVSLCSKSSVCPSRNNLQLEASNGAGVPSEGRPRGLMAFWDGYKLKVPADRDFYRDIERGCKSLILLPAVFDDRVGSLQNVEPVGKLAEGSRRHFGNPDTGEVIHCHAFAGIACD